MKFDSNNEYWLEDRSQKTEEKRSLFLKQLPGSNFKLLAKRMKF